MLLLSEYITTILAGESTCIDGFCKTSLQYAVTPLHIPLLATDVAKDTARDGLRVASPDAQWRVTGALKRDGTGLVGVGDGKRFLFFMLTHGLLRFTSYAVTSTSAISLMLMCVSACCLVTLVLMCPCSLVS